MKTARSFYLFFLKIWGKNRSITDSRSWPMLTIWDIEGDADGSTLGMKREISLTDDMLIASSSTREFAENS